MAMLPRPARPSVLVADIRAFFATREKHQLIFAGLAVLVPALIIWGFYHDAAMDQPPTRTIIYVQSWPANRSDEEIIAQQKIDKAIKDKAAAEKQAAYKRLADKLGIE
ncbi:hypothetical protein [Sphingomonas sp. ID0503]|uniref:hypothetical protein n=1 Tax=Sphingomonas sp. ID0503 TaxID=3399691 RepID=UPI003AFB15C9